MQSFDRGNTLFFSGNCTDASGVPVTPDTATLYLWFLDSAGKKNNVSVVMTIAASKVTANWDSSVAGPGPVHWSIRAAAAGIKVAEDGDITINANKANPLPPA